MPKIIIKIIIIIFFIGSVYWIYQSISATKESGDIEQINPPLEVENFDEQGNLVQNNPGMQPDKWYLIYEKPGQMALNKKLEFTSSSVCFQNTESYICDEEKLQIGARVHIIGEMVEEDIVRVIRLEAK